MNHYKPTLRALTRLSLETPSYPTEKLAEDFQYKIQSLRNYSKSLEYINRLRSSIRYKKILRFTELGWQTDFFDQFYQGNSQINPPFLNLSTASNDKLATLYREKGWLNFHRSKISDDMLSRPKKITLITSMFNCAEWMKLCLDNFTQQTAFGECELLLFDCEGNHELFIECYPYLVQHENIRYIRLISDPGLYGVWNIGIQIGEGIFIGNMNTDDLRSPFQIETLANILETEKNVSIASTAIVPYQEEDIQNIASLGLSLANSTSLWPSQEEAWYTYLNGLYGIEHLFKLDDTGMAIESQCIPHCAPLWKKSIHEKCGLFNEAFYSSAADWGLWCTALAKGEQAYVVGEPYTYYYVNTKSYMRRDSSAELVSSMLCSSYNDKLISSLTESKISYNCGLDPLNLIDFVVNLP